MFESLKCPQGEKMDLSQIFDQRFKYEDNAGKRKYLQNMEDFSEEQQATNKGLEKQIKKDDLGNNTLY